MKIIVVDNSTLDQDKNLTYLSADVVSGTDYIQVQTTDNVNGSLILCIGEIGKGQQKTEIKKILVANGGSIRLTANTLFDHSQDTKVSVIDYDRLEVSYASTITGTKSTLSGYLKIQVDKEETQYKDTSQSSGYYFTRFNESFGDTYSDYSDPVPYTGYPANAVFSIKDRALKSVGEEISDLITNDFLDECLWQARREFHSSPGKRPFRKVYGKDIGNIRTGIYRVKVPSDLERPQTAENIYGVRVGVQKNMDYYDKKEFDNDYINTAHSTLAVALSTTDSFVVLADNRDFTDKGNVRIDGYTLKYSIRDVDNGSLILTAVASTAHALGADVWQNISEGLPTKFTVLQDPDTSCYIAFERPFDTAYSRQNIYADYYKTMAVADSDADELDEPDPMSDAYVYYLAWRIKHRKNQGLQPLNDPDYIKWETLKKQELDKEYLGVDISLIPDIP